MAESLDLKNKISDDIKLALKARDDARVSTLRMALAAINNKEIERRKKDIGLSDEEIIEVVRSEIKKRKDAILEFEKGGRSDLVEKEKMEQKILAEYIPQEVSDEEIARVVREGIREAGTKNMDGFGKVMKLAMQILKGKASGDRVSEILKNELSGR